MPQSKNSVTVILMGDPMPTEPEPESEFDTSLLPREPVDRLQSDAFIDSAIRRARTDVGIWVSRERQMYADVKWNASTHNQLVRDLRDDPHQEAGGRQYLDWVYDYILRARQFGLDSLQGRQALGKALVTLTHMTESTVVAFGRMPEPGVPSGEVK